MGNAPRNLGPIVPLAACVLAWGSIAACPARNEAPHESAPREEARPSAPTVEPVAASTRETEASVEIDAVEASPEVDAGQDVRSTKLSLDLSRAHGRAEVAFGPTSAPTRALEVGSLHIEAVTMDGQPLEHEVRDGRLEARVSGPPREVTLIVDYGFESTPALDGYLGDRGLSFLWPTACRNLFPCVTSPEDGTTFELLLQGVPEGVRAIYPRTISTPAPSYMVALAIGDYRYRSLGVTKAGTTVGLYYFEADEDEALGEESGVLPAAFDWLERTYGPYAFGGEVASVQVSWPTGGYSGMEHHPYWHVETHSIGDARTHVHEAAHGWFGNGVRIRCWEDLVLSEGVTSYLTERALEEVGGPSSWERYEASHAWSEPRLEPAWPEGCTRTEPQLSSVVYVEGALFMRAVEQAVGRDALDAVLADFYRRNVGKAASMSELVEAIERGTHHDLAPLVDAWLR